MASIGLHCSEDGYTEEGRAGTHALGDGLSFAHTMLYPPFQFDDLHIQVTVLSKTTDHQYHIQGQAFIATIKSRAMASKRPNYHRRLPND